MKKLSVTLMASGSYPVDSGATGNGCPEKSRHGADPGKHDGVVEIF